MVFGVLVEDNLNAFSFIDSTLGSRTTSPEQPAPLTTTPLRTV